MHSTSTTTLTSFRSGLFGCFPSWGDALFELTDAALCSATPVASVPGLSLEPVFRRSHGSLYKSLCRGNVDEGRLRDLVVDHRPRSWPTVFAVDTSTWERSEAECSPERGFYYSASKHSAGQPIVAGWSYQWIAQLNFDPDSWTAPLDVRRIPPGEDGTEVTIGQVKALVGRMGTTKEIPMFVFDAGYDPIALTHGLTGTRAEVLCRLRGNRIFYRDPPPRRPGVPGRPQRHGQQLRLSGVGSLGPPDSEVTIDEARYGTVRVRAWHGVHPRIAAKGRWALPFGVVETPIVRGSVIRVDAERLPKAGRSQRMLWLWWGGEGEPADLELCAVAYLHRFDLEHTFRFAKTTMGWTTPALCTPEQADRWTWLVLAALAQLRLARPLVEDLRLPWERRLEPTKLTPNRVRRGFRRLCGDIGTPANPPKSKKPGPGRPKGTRRPPRTRHPVVKRAA